MRFKQVFKNDFTLIGMVHLLSLPGAPRFNGNLKAIEKRAIEDTISLEKGGVDALIVENFGDYPFLNGKINFFPLLCFTNIASRIVDRTKIPVGINIEFNCYKQETATANAIGASFIRIEVFNEMRLNYSGLLFPTMAKLLRYRKQINAEEVMIFTDINVKHTMSIFDYKLEELIYDINYFADTIIVTGSATGKSIDIDYLKTVKKLSKIPLIVGSGVSTQNIKEVSEIADGAIVGTFFKKDGNVENPVDERRVEELLRIFRR